MLNALKNIIKNFLRKQGLYVDKSTSVFEVAKLLTTLQPVKIDKPLIRLGPDKDGGYLVPDDLENIHACFSPGVGRMSNFEVSCLENGMKLFLADKSVDGPGVENSELHFLKKFVGPLNNESFITLDDWVKDSISSTKKDLMLQMDIEGYEYVTLLNSSEELLKKCRVVVVEFHNLHKLWNQEFYKTAALTFQKLLQFHYCIHIHPNNIKKPYIHQGIAIPSVAEFTFIRKDRVERLGMQTQFPHPLDCDNTPNPSVVLPQDWYAS